MRRLLLAALLTLALGGVALAQTPAPPLNMPPQPGANPTANLIFNAMMAVARAAASNPQAAQNASLSYQHALQSYNLGDIEGARSQAIQALIEANRQQPSPIATIEPYVPPTALRTQPFPLAGGSVAQIDADAFVAQARGAVQACQAAKSPNAAPASAKLAAAERDARSGKYTTASSEARAAVDLCATSKRP